MICLV